MEKDYQSWCTIELQIGNAEKHDGLFVHTRTSIGRSHYDFEMQNRTVREFKRRFGGKTFRDGGNGSGYDPGPPLSAAASGCHLAMQRLDWNLTRVNVYLLSGRTNQTKSPLAEAEKLWSVTKELNPEVFLSNVLVTYLVSAMEDYLKSTYIALLTYSARKSTVLKNIRLSGDQLAQISSGALSVEQAAAETLPFQRLAAVGRNFADIDARLDILAPLRRPYRRRKRSLFDRLEEMVSQRHALIHKMDVNRDLDKSGLEGLIHDLTVGMSRIYKEITQHYSWPFELPMSSNFLISKPRKSLKRKK